MTNSLKKEIETIIHSQGLNCPVEKFKKKLIGILFLYVNLYL